MKLYEHIAHGMDEYDMAVMLTEQALSRTTSEFFDGDMGDMCDNCMVMDIAKECPLYDKHHALGDCSDLLASYLKEDE